MIKVLPVLLFILAGGPFLKAQNSQQYNDSVILADMIKPLLNKALEAQDVPDWQVLSYDVQNKYGQTYVDRSVTKARIYYYFGKDWPTFSKALVHYTEAYEDKGDAKLMNKNAKMVLLYSQDTTEWKAALSWAKHAVDKEPGNAVYKETYDALAVKVKGQVAGVH